MLPSPASFMKSLVASYSSITFRRGQRSVADVLDAGADILDVDIFSMGFPEAVLFHPGGIFLKHREEPIAFQIDSANRHGYGDGGSQKIQALLQ